MARTTEEIKKQITDLYIAERQIVNTYRLEAGKDFEQQFSKLSVESIMFYDFAYCCQIVERLMDTHRAEVVSIIDNLKPHTALWYSNKAKAFQYGFDLLPESDRFDNGEATDEDIAASKIVKFASVSELDGQLYIKVAKQGEGLEPLTPAELSAFTTYINKVKDAGVHINTSSNQAEKLQLNLEIWYNPLVLNADGKRIDGSKDTPVIQALNAFLAGVEFDGNVILAELVDALQRVDGVAIPHIAQAAYKYGDIVPIQFNVMRRPQSGYMILDTANSNIIYHTYSE